MKNLKDIYSGQRLFVMGNGLSLKDTPLDLLKDEYSFGINRVGMIFDKTEWRPNFFFCATFRVKRSKDYKNDVLKCIQLGIPSFIGNRIKSQIGTKYKNVRYIHCLHIEKRHTSPKDGWWKKDISKGEISLYGQSLLGVMQIAVYMGFNPIYTVGIDGYRPKKQGPDLNHFDPEYETSRQRHSDKWFRERGLTRIEKSHQLIYRVTKEMGVDVFDATVVENNSPYPKVNIEDIL